MTQTDNAGHTWAVYYARLGPRGPRPQLLQALTYCDEPGFAIDLGCGTGIETVALLARGWHVLAIDGQAQALELLQAAVPAELTERLVTQQAQFEEVVLPQAQLIHAGYSLPFCHPDHFDALWRAISVALPAGGLFVGQLFGDRDGWAGRADMTFHTEAQLAARLAPFETLVLTVRDEPGTIVTGAAKHWHVFDVIARRL